MEMVISEEGNCDANICNLVPKSSIGLTSAEVLSTPKKKEVDKCEHFSIRGYVAEVCGKDWKTCWPFSSLGEDEESKEQLADVLPPLHIPKFRRWDCRKCLQRTSEDNIYKGSKGDANSSMDVIDSESCPMMHEDTQEKIIISTPNIGQGVFPSSSKDNKKNTLRRGVDRPINEQTFRQVKYTQCLEGKATKDAETVNLNFEGCGLDEFGGTNCEFTAIRAPIIAKSVGKVEEMMCHENTNLETLENQDVNFLVGCQRRKIHPFESSDDEDEDVHNLHDIVSADQIADSGQTLSYKKPQKFRLLSNILKEDMSDASTKVSSLKGVTSSDNFNVNVNQTKASKEPSGLALDIESVGQRAVQAKFKSISGRRNKRRKTLQDEGQQPMQMRCLKSLTKDLEIHKRDQEKKDSGSLVVNDKLTNSEFPSEALHGYKTNFSENGTDEKVSQNCMRNKTQLKDKDPQREVDGSPKRGLHPFLNTNMAALGSKIKSFSEDTWANMTYPGTSRNKGTEKSDTESPIRRRKHEVADTESKRTLVSYHEGIAKDKIIGKEREIEQDGAAGIFFRSEDNASFGRSGHCDLKSKSGSLSRARRSTKQNDIHECQEGTCSVRPKDSPFAYNSETKDSQGQPKATINKSNGRPYNMGESVSLNDIPLEIVELLAKNRHERRRLEAKNTKQTKFCPSKTTENGKDCESICSLRGKNLKELQQTCKSIGSNRNQRLQSCDTDDPFALSYSSNHYNGNQFVEAGNGNNFSVYYSRWDGDTLGYGWPISSSQCSTSYIDHQIRAYPTLMGGANGPSIAEYSQKLVTRSQRQNRKDFEMSENIISQPCACTQKKIGNFSKPVDSINVYTNEFMPATQLLKLMDAGMSTRRPHTLDGKLEFENQLQILEPMDAGMSFKRPHALDGKLEFENKFPIPETDYSREHFPLKGGLTPDHLKQAASVCFTKGYSDSGMHFPSLPTSDPVVFPVGSWRINGKRSETIYEREKSVRGAKRKISCFPMQVDCKLKEFGFASGDLAKNQDPFPINGLQSRFHSLSNPWISPLESRLKNNVIGKRKVSKKVGTFQPMNGNLGTEICSLNRNPADFTVPGPGNLFMIEGRELNRGKVVSKRGRPRQRTMKLLDV